MQLCSKPRGARGVGRKTFRRRGQLLSRPPATGPMCDRVCISGKTGTVNIAYNNGASASVDGTTGHEYGAWLVAVLVLGKAFITSSDLWPTRGEWDSMQSHTCTSTHLPVPMCQYPCVSTHVQT